MFFFFFFFDMLGCIRWLNMARLGLANNYNCWPVLALTQGNFYRFWQNCRKKLWYSDGHLVVPGIQQVKIWEVAKADSVAKWSRAMAITNGLPMCIIPCHLLGICLGGKQYVCSEVNCTSWPLFWDLSLCHAADGPWLRQLHNYHTWHFWR